MHGLASGARFSTIFPWKYTIFPWKYTIFPWKYTIFPWKYTTSVDRYAFRWPLASGISACVRRYGFGRRNPCFFMR